MRLRCVIFLLVGVLLSQTLAFTDVNCFDAETPLYYEVMVVAYWMRDGVTQWHIDPNPYIMIMLLDTCDSSAFGTLEIASFTYSGEAMLFGEWPGHLNSKIVSVSGAELTCNRTAVAIAASSDCFAPVVCTMRYSNYRKCGVIDMKKFKKMQTEYVQVSVFELFEVKLDNGTIDFIKVVTPDTAA
jgi:hypothetical protein